MQTTRQGPSTTASRVNGRTVNGHSRSKSQAPRPRTVHGVRAEEQLESPTGNGTTIFLQENPQLYIPIHCDKIRAKRSSTILPTIRDSSLASKFVRLTIDDDKAPGNQAISRPSTRQSSQSSIASQISNLPYIRRGRDDQSDRTAITSRQASSERA
jgi:hypothetical protein